MVLRIGVMYWCATICEETDTEYQHDTADMLISAGTLLVFTWPV